MTNILSTDAITGFDPVAYHNRIEEQAMADGGIDSHYWDTPGLRVTRLSLVSDPGYPYWDVAYCHGTLNGKHVEVRLPFRELPKRGMTRAIVARAKRDGVYAKGIGILDAVSLLQ